MNRAEMVSRAATVANEAIAEAVSAGGVLDLPLFQGEKVGASMTIEITIGAWLIFWATAITVAWASRGKVR